MRTVRFGRNAHFCREMGYVPNRRFLVLFWLRFDSGLRQIRFHSDIWSSVAVRLSSALSPQSSVLGPQSSVLSPRSSVLSPQSSVFSLQSSVLSPQSSVPRSSGCNKLYKCGSQNIGKQWTFVAGRLKTAVLLQKPWFTAFLSRMSRKTQHTCFEDKILGKLANEDKPQVVTPWLKVEPFKLCKNAYLLLWFFRLEAFAKVDM